MKRLAGTFIAILFSASLLLLSEAYAINYGGIGGSPAYPNPANPRSQSIFIFQLKPGQSATNGIKVENDTNKQQVITLDAVDSELATGGQFTCKQAVEAKTDVGAWIKLQTTSVTLKAYTSTIVPFTLTVPDSNQISVGEHDGCVTLQAQSQTAAQSSQNGVVLSFRSAIRVVVTIPGKLVKKLSIKSLTVTATKNGEYQVTPSIENQGNVSLDASLRLQLVSILGFAPVSVKEGTMPVLPNSDMSDSYNVAHPFWGGLYMARAIVKYNSDPNTELGLQPHSNLAQISLNSKMFFATPQPLAAFIEAVVIVAIVWLIVWLSRRNKHKRTVNKKWQSYSVKHGDTVEKIAKNSNISWKKIVTANHMKPPYSLKEDQVIKIPPSNKD